MFAEKGNLPIAVIMEMVGDTASRVDVVDGDEVAVAAFGRTGDVRVDQHDRDFRPLADPDDFPVRRGVFLRDVGAEDDAFRTDDGEFSDLAPDVPDGGFVVSFTGEDELDLVIEPFAVSFELVLDVREELERFEVGDDESDDTALAKGATCQERSGAVALFDEPLALQFGKSSAHYHARGREGVAELRFAWQFPPFANFPAAISRISFS